MKKKHKQKKSNQKKIQSPGIEKFAVCGVVLMIIIACLLLVALKIPETALSEKVVQINDHTVLAEVADTEEKRTRGLSGREAFGTGKGMLFIFDRDGSHPFWMKDMRFSIDIIWLSVRKEIVHITHSASPTSYPTLFIPLKPARYVLEVSAGYATENGLEVGDIITWK